MTKINIMKLNKLIIFTLLNLLLAPSILFAQSVDKIISKHIKAHGGTDKWEQVKVLKTTGKFTAFSTEKEFTTYKTKSGAFYSSLYLGERHISEAYNGKFGWTIDPWQEIEYARKINSGETNVFLQKCEFFTPFYKYKEKGHKVEYLGVQKLDGSNMFVLNLTRKNGKSEKWYLNTKTYLEYKCDTEWVDFAVAMPAEIYFDDFRNIEGLTIPFFIERTFGQRDRIIQIENVIINPEFDTKLLEMPKRKEISKLNFMAGKWNVKLEFVDRKGKYQSAGSSESTIYYSNTNLLSEKISYENYFPYSLNINYSYNPKHKNFRVTYFNDFSSSIDIFQGKLIDNTLIIEDTNIYFDKKEKENKICKQFIYTKINSDKFTVESKISNNEGNTWSPNTKFTYTRKTN